MGFFVFRSLQNNCNKPWEVMSFIINDIDGVFKAKGLIYFYNGSFFFLFHLVSFFIQNDVSWKKIKIYPYAGIESFVPHRLLAFIFTNKTY